MHFYGWKSGLKTGMYYLRTRPAAQAIQFTVDAAVLKEVKAANETAKVANRAKTAAAVTLPAAAAPEPAVAVVTKDVASLKLVDGTSGMARKPELTDSPVLAPSQDSGTTTPIVVGTPEKVKQAAAEDPEFAAALQRQRDREYEQEKIMCSIKNKEACVMCSG
jgi:ribonucleoside-diphosphate reductase subunit M1